MVISGRQSWRNDSSVDVRANLQLSKQEISLQEPSPCYLMPLEEAPKKSAIAMMLFVQSKGSKVSVKLEVQLLNLLIQVLGLVLMLV